MDSNSLSLGGDSYALTLLHPLIGISKKTKQTCTLHHVKEPSFHSPSPAFSFIRPGRVRTEVPNPSSQVFKHLCSRKVWQSRRDRPQDKWKTTRLDFLCSYCCTMCPHASTEQQRMGKIQVLGGQEEGPLGFTSTPQCLGTAQCIPDETPFSRAYTQMRNWSPGGIC